MLLRRMRPERQTTRTAPLWTQTDERNFKAGSTIREREALWPHLPLLSNHQGSESTRTPPSIHQQLSCRCGWWRGHPNPHHHHSQGQVHLCLYLVPSWSSVAPVYAENSPSWWCHTLHGACGVVALWKTAIIIMYIRRQMTAAWPQPDTRRAADIWGSGSASACSLITTYNAWKDWWECSINLLHSSHTLSTVWELVRCHVVFYVSEVKVQTVRLSSKTLSRVCLFGVFKAILMLCLWEEHVQLQHIFDCRSS